MRRQPWETAASPDYHNYSKMLTIAQNAEVWSSISYHFWQRGRTHDSQEVARVVALPATSNLLPAAQLPQSRLPLHAQVVLDPPHLHPPHLTYTHLAHAHTHPHLHARSHSQPADCCEQIGLSRLRLQFAPPNYMSNKLNPIFVFWMKYFAACVFLAWCVYRIEYWR